MKHHASRHGYVSIRRILSACTSAIVSSYQHPCILHLHPTISHVCTNCTLPFPMSLTIASNQQSYHSANLCLQVCMTDTLALDQQYIQSSVLSVVSSNDCYNCTGQAGLYQPAAKMVAKVSVILSVQYTLPFITSCFEGMFSQSRIFNENNMVLSDAAKSGLESAWFMD